MRIIKFRIWDSNNKCFVYPDILELNRGLRYQQYTGLSDKKGKEIYEGDIVYYQYGSQGSNEWEVAWDYDKWILKRGERETGDLNCDDDPHYNDWGKAEVIGNEYEKEVKNGTN